MFDNGIFIEYTFEARHQDLNREFLIAILNHVGFQGFDESDSRIKAYIAEDDDRCIKIDEILCMLITDIKSVGYTRKVIHPQNWNQRWEKSFQPININDKVYIRAPFHPQIPRIEYDLIIEPKMSFGTGHHETTRLMISSMLNSGIKNVNLLDVGCGTGVLSILASKLQASNILAIDIDSWAIENCIENRDRNDCKNITVQQCTVSDLSGLFQVILANINTNVILKEFSEYSRLLDCNGLLILSGIMTKDIEMIKEAAGELSFKVLVHNSEEGWHLLKMIKPKD